MFKLSNDASLFMKHQRNVYLWKIASLSIVNTDMIVEQHKFDMVPMELRRAHSWVWGDANFFWVLYSLELMPRII